MGLKKLWSLLGHPVFLPNIMYLNFRGWWMETLVSFEKMFTPLVSSLAFHIQITTFSKFVSFWRPFFCLSKRQQIMRASKAYLWVKHWMRFLFQNMLSYQHLGVIQVNIFCTLIFSSYSYNMYIIGPTVHYTLLYSITLNTIIPYNYNVQTKRMLDKRGRWNFNAKILPSNKVFRTTNLRALRALSNCVTLF
jgi:hypothetical protein